MIVKKRKKGREKEKKTKSPTASSRSEDVRRSLTFFLNFLYEREALRGPGVTTRFIGHVSSALLFTSVSVAGFIILLDGGLSAIIIFSPTFFISTFSL